MAKRTDLTAPSTSPAVEASEVEIEPDATSQDATGADATEAETEAEQPGDIQPADAEVPADAAGSETETPAPAPTASSALAPLLSVKERITLGGRGAKVEKDDTGAIIKTTAAAEPTILVYSGTMDLSALADPANAIHVRNLAAVFLIDAVSKNLRAKVRAGAVIPETGFTPEEVSTAVSEAITSAFDPFAAKVRAAAIPGAAKATTAKLKAEVGAATTKVADLNALVALIGPAIAAGDMVEAQRIQEAMKLRASQP